MKYIGWQDIRKALEKFPDSLFLVDWTEGITNLYVMNGILDTYCFFESCKNVARHASLFLIATNLSRSEFLEHKGGNNIVARTNEYSLFEYL